MNVLQCGNSIERYNMLKLNHCPLLHHFQAIITFLFWLFGVCVCGSGLFLSWKRSMVTALKGKQCKITYCIWTVWPQLSRKSLSATLFNPRIPFAAGSSLRVGQLLGRVKSINVALFNQAVHVNMNNILSPSKTCQQNRRSRDQPSIAIYKSSFGLTVVMSISIAPAIRQNRITFVSRSRDSWEL